MLARRAALALVLASCASAPPTPDAGHDDAGVASDAGRPDAGGDAGTVGGLDAGPAEPLLSSSVLFRDDFDGYATTQALRAAYPELREQGGVIALEQDGGSSLRLDYAAPAACATVDVHVGKLVAGDVPTVMVTWRALVPSGFLACADGHVSHFMLTRGGAGTTAFEATASGWALDTGASRFEQHLRLESHAPATLTPNAWHRVTLVVTRESSPGSADGAVQAWVDGALVIDLVGATGTAPFSLATWPGSVTLDAAGSRWIDDLAISTP